ncbi:hypothetical protein QUG98_12800 [Curtobacterium sp. RHCJP20]|uniref:Uncharacterized protein n=1 Tax=Curtobacterium subtropicum TaxID=3055138 RepID=A0ABT7TIB8_9MICO|nr:hypothetical protein [Curtobacterium subtropicum]MDM7889329.1 hypothetical protein [Curtobacterium subtropicum]
MVAISFSPPLTARPLVATGAVLVALVSGLVTAPDPAAAAPGSSTTSTERGIRDLVEQAQSWDALSDSETTAAVAVWSGSGRTSSSGLPLDLARAQAFVTVDGTVLRLPFAEGADVLPESSVTAVLDGGRVRTWSELVLTPTTADSGRLQTWINGIAGLDRDVTAQPAARSTWWSRFSSCLNSAGVAAWAITALTIACSAACLVTAGVGCIACITAAGAATSGTISFCAGKASRG